MSQAKYSADGRTAIELFDLSERVIVVTGGAGLLGQRHAEAIASARGIPVIADRRGDAARQAAAWVGQQFGVDACGLEVDITDRRSVEAMRDDIVHRFGRVDGLINNAANNPKVEDTSAVQFSRLEDFPLEQWGADVSVGLTGAFLCSQALGTEMARRGRGVIVNVSSEYGVIAPDQRLYQVDGLTEDRQPVKPITYTVVKAGLDGMTRYVATYWAHKGVRVNTITVGGVFNQQPASFLERAEARIPLGRMARADEYRGAILFLCSDASSFMTGANLIVDGGKSTW